MVEIVRKAIAAYITEAYCIVPRAYLGDIVEVNEQYGKDYVFTTIDMNDTSMLIKIVKRK